ncbi:hypothetical protein [Bdellovibrio bacteriovorus]|uniref:Uncharacterized protein n=1 Tax=Bdellovibrio bacteriovorus str. Tiberius TaxID=1069642 RepID=K7ZDR2_BDEBC|nr:hypothetical protein [Bdellovibrio bacteriovorus]AFX99761.1 hypothetical protein Bdt_0048 [Bdellovibrio bacteriovorus str. Tiberius]
MKFIPIYEALTIKAQKNSPPHIAFEELLESERQLAEWSRIEKVKPLNLAAEKSTAPLFAKRVEISEMVIQKTPERFIAEAPTTKTVDADPTAWMNDLSPAQAKRLQAAQSRSEVIGQDWSQPTWSDMAKEVLEKSGVLTEATASSNPRVYVAGVDASGKASTKIPQAEVRIPDRNNQPSDDGMNPSYGLVEEQRPAGIRTISGPLEITGGLAVTNEHHIEIRRSDEGVLKELGKVNLVQGQYNIDVEDVTGSIIARLVDKEGKTLGEGSFRLNRVASIAQNRLQGPKIRIEPHPDFGGIVTSAYNPKPDDAAPAKTLVTFVKGAKEVAPKKDGAVAMDNVTKGSTTVMRAAAPSHMQTASIVVSGQEFKTPLYPASMIQALQDILSQQRQMSFEGAPTIIWGKVSLDGKTLSGIDVVVESDQSLVPVYFNQFMLPDPSLKATGDNGLFAFVNAEPGFHSLLATRAEAIVGYQNVVVEEGSVAQGDIQSTMKNESVPLRVYDAFAGDAVPATVTMQSLQSEFEVQGATTVTLPNLRRYGLMRVQPEGTDYVAARYVYNDNDEYVHAPVVRWSWLSAIKGYLKIDDLPTAGVIVGFVPDENFEVYLAAYDSFNPRQIVYFDMQGKILQNGKGIAGGGFILYNVPEDIHEVVVVGERTQKIYSRVLPVDPNTLSVLSFRE